ncbi:MAG: hypothetical protein QM776_01500 [Rhodocyclaceae bacterium]
MLTSRAALLLILVTLVTAACGTTQVSSRTFFNKAQASNIRKIIIAERADPERYVLSSGYSPYRGPFTIISSALGGLDSATRSNELETAVQPAKTLLQQRFLDDLGAQLKSQGYETVRKPIGAKLDEAAALAAIGQLAPDEAALIVNVQGSYIAANPFSAYVPFVVSRVALFGADHKRLYDQTASWGGQRWRNDAFHMNGGYGFAVERIPDFPANADKARQGFYTGSLAVAEHLALGLSRN